MEELALEVRRVFALLTRELGEAFSLPMLIREISFWRGKPLRVEQVPMPVNVTGYCVALQDVDLIRTRAGLDPILAEAACLHECAHILLAHLPRLSAGPTTPTYQQFTQKADAALVFYRAHASIYDDPRERDAESLATLLGVCLENEKTSIPLSAREMHV